MKNIFVLIFLLFAAFVFAQSPGTPDIQFQASFRITNAVNGALDTVIISGYVDECAGRFTNSDIAIGDSIYVLEGSDLLVFGAVTTRTISLGIATFKAIDFGGAGILPSNGQAAIFRPTTNYQFPGDICGLNPNLQQYITARFMMRLDDILSNIGGSVVVSDSLDALAPADEILGTDRLVRTDSTITFQKLIDQTRDSIWHTVNDYTEIAALSVRNGRRILDNSTGAQYLTQADTVQYYQTDGAAVIALASNNYAVLQGNGNRLNTLWFSGTDNEILDKSSRYANATRYKHIDIGQDTLILTDTVLLRSGVTFEGTCIGCGDLGAGVEGTVILANLNDASKPVFVVDSISSNISNIGLKNVSIQAISPAKTAVQLIHPNDFDVTGLNINGGGGDDYFTYGMMVSGAVDFDFRNSTIQNVETGMYFYLSNFPGTTTNLFKFWIKDCNVGIKVDSSAAVVTVEHSIFERIDSSCVIVENDDFYASYLFTEGVSINQHSAVFDLGTKTGAPIEPVYSFDKCQIATALSQDAGTPAINVNYATSLDVSTTIFVNNAQTLQATANTMAINWNYNKERTASGRVLDYVGVPDTSVINGLGNTIGISDTPVNFIHSIKGELTLSFYDSDYTPLTDPLSSVLSVDSTGKVILSDITAIGGEFVDIYNYGATKDVEEDQSPFIDSAIATGKNVLIGHTADDTIWISRPIEPLSNTVIRINATVILLPFDAITLGVNVSDGATSVTVPNSALFEIGQWVGISDDDSAVQGSTNQTRRVGASVKITNIPNATTLTVVEVEGNYTTAQNAYIGRLGNIVLLENDTNVVIQGNGVLDVSWTEQIDIEGLRVTGPASSREEVSSQCGISMEECSDITIEGLTIQNAGLHNISDIKSSYVTISGVKLLNAHDKNIVGQETGVDWNISDVFIDGAIFEDGIIFYTGPTSVNVNNVEIKNCNRYGIFINEVGSEFNGNFNNIKIENCKYQFACEGDNVNISNVILVAGDSTQHNFWFDGANNIKLTNTVIEGNNEAVGLVYGFNDCSDVIVDNFTVKDIDNANYALRVVGTGDNVSFLNGHLDNVARGHEVGSSTTNTTFNNIDFSTIITNKGTQDTVRATYIKCFGLPIENYIDADFHIGKEYFGDTRNTIVTNPLGGTNKLQPALDSLYNNLGDPDTNTNYANTDLTATGNRSHTWGTNNQTETYTSGDFKIANTGSSNSFLVDGATGNVGIGTVPVSKLHVNGGNFYLVNPATADATLLFGESTSAGAYALMKWSSSTDALQFGTETGNFQLFLDESGFVGVGNDPTAKFHVYNNSSGVTLETGIRVEQAGPGDSKVGFKLSGGQDWAIGIDNDDSDAFGISTVENLSGKVVRVSTAGQLSLLNYGDGTFNAADDIGVLSYDASGNIQELLLAKMDSLLNSIKPFGQMNFEDSMYVINPSGVTPITNDGNDLFTVDGDEGTIVMGGDSCIVSHDGLTTVIYEMSISSAGGVYYLGLSINGVAVNNKKSHFTLVGGTETIPFTYSFVANGSPTPQVLKPVIVQVSGADPTLVDGSFMVLKQ